MLAVGTAHCVLIVIVVRTPNLLYFHIATNGSKMQESPILAIIPILVIKANLSNSSGERTVIEL